jgi:hypothetical protein
MNPVKRLVTKRIKIELVNVLLQWEAAIHGGSKDFLVQKYSLSCEGN